MPKFMINASYSAEGIKSVLKEGGSGRVAAIEQLASAVDGSVEAVYFAFRGSDLYAIVIYPTTPPPPQSPPRSERRAP